MSDAAQAHGDHGHHEPASFVSKYVFALDHKVIAIQFMLGGLFFLLVGGSMALLLRWQLANPFVPVPVVGPFLFP